MIIPTKYTQQFPTNLENPINWTVLINNSENNLNHLNKIDTAAKNNGQLLYRYFKLPVADNTAYYQVTNIKGNNATLTRCTGICLDEYSDHILGEESILPLKKVQELIQQRDKFEALFR